MTQNIGELVESARRGDSDAYTALYNATIGGALGRARSMVRLEQDAMDVVQDSYIEAFRSLDRLENPASFAGWLNRIVTNRCKNLLGRSKALKYEVSLTDGEGEELDKEDESITFRPDASLDYSETKRMIREIVDSLPDEQRACILLHYFQDMKISEIAQLLGVSENTVKSRIYYAKGKIEKEVRALERKGTRLYAVPAIPFLRWAMEQSTLELAAAGSEAMLANVIGAAAVEGAAAGSAAAAASAASGAPASAASAGSAAASGAGATAAKAGLLGTVNAKITAGALAAAIAVGGAAAALSAGEQAPPPPPPPPAAEEVVPAQAQPPPVTDGDIIAIIELINVRREELGLPPLAADDDMMEMAAIRAGETAQSFGGARPDGSEFGSVFTENGLEIPFELRESRARTAGGAEDIIEQWIDGEDQNLFDAGAVKIGIGYHYDGASGAGGHWTALLCGEPEPEPEPVVEPPPATVITEQYLYQMIDIMNAERVGKGLTALAADPDFMAVAAAIAGQCADIHASGGSGSGIKADGYFVQQGRPTPSEYSYRYNAAKSITAEELLDDVLLYIYASPITHPQGKVFGLGVYPDPDSPGKYFWCAMAGDRLQQSASSIGDVGRWIELVNRAREDNGLEPLTVSDELMELAQDSAERLVGATDAEIRAARVTSGVADMMRGYNPSDGTVASSSGTGFDYNNLQNSPDAIVEQALSLSSPPGIYSSDREYYIGVGFHQQGGEFIWIMIWHYFEML